MDKARDYDDFLAGLQTLITIPSRQSEPAEVAALEVAWWPELEDRRWIDGPLWLRAVREAQTTCSWRPAMAEMLGICEFAATQRELEEWRASNPALPAPTVVDDPSTTPEERERWAREDAFIRGYIPGVLREWEAGAYLNDWGPHPTKPGVLIRTAPEDMARLLDSHAYDLALMKVPDMTIEQRRARDRRIEGAKDGSRAAVKAGRWPGAEDRK
jgi:hypothetical protein